MIQKKLSYKEVESARRMLESCRKVAIVCHTSPDGDAIGSSLALYEYLKDMGKTVSVVVPGYFPDFLHWMTDSDKIVMYDKQRAMGNLLLSQADLICVLDLNDPGRLEDLGRAVERSTAKKLMIDHHLDPVRFCDLTISYPQASSTCELVFRLIYAMGGERHLTKAGAEDIYAGMCTDTGRFSYNSNDPDIFIIIAELLKKGIDKDKIVRNIYNNYTEQRFRLLGHILKDKLEVYAEQHACLYHVTRAEQSEYHFLKGDLEGVVNLPLEIRGVTMSISLREDTEKDRIMVSVRTVDDKPANLIAEKYFNGGGHLNAAGGMLWCGMDEALDIARKAIKDNEF